MKSMLRYAPLVLMFAGFLFSSCDLATVPKATPDSRPANHVVINEVFTLPESSTNPYSWIEFYNPTGQRIVGLNNWTLSYSYRIGLAGFDTLVTLEGRLTSIIGAVPDTLEPGQFLVLFGDSISFYVHTNLGPGKGTATTYVPPFDLPGQGGIQFGRLFQIPESAELVLRDTSGNVVDVVRYGNFVPSSPDPFAGNQSAGVIPQWSSLCRYAGAYATGNTANDFYMEPKPIPMWYSELNHP